MAVEMEGKRNVNDQFISMNCTPIIFDPYISLTIFDTKETKLLSKFDVCWSETLYNILIGSPDVILEHLSNELTPTCTLNVYIVSTIVQFRSIHS